MIVGKSYGPWEPYSLSLDESAPEKMEIMPIIDHGKTSVGYWRSMPGTFDWHYDIDQTALIIDGKVELRMHGTSDFWSLDTWENQEYHRHPLHFTAGTTVTWKVIKPVFLFFVNKKPGRIGSFLTKVKHKISGFAESQIQQVNLTQKEEI